MTNNQQKNEETARLAIGEYLRDRENFWKDVYKERSNTPDAQTWQASWRGAEAALRRWTDHREISDLTAEAVGERAEQACRLAWEEITTPAGPDKLQKVLTDSLAVWRGLEALGYDITQAGR